MGKKIKGGKKKKQKKCAVNFQNKWFKSAY